MTTIIIQVFIPIILGSLIFLIGYFYGRNVQRKFEEMRQNNIPGENSKVY